MIVNVHRRNFEAEMLNDPMAAMAVCAYMEGDLCPNMQITNNIIAGGEFYGIIVMGHTCDDDNDYTFKDNVVHSIAG